MAAIQDWIDNADRPRDPLPVAAIGTVQILMIALRSRSPAYHALRCVAVVRADWPDGYRTFEAIGAMAAEAAASTDPSKGEPSDIAIGRLIRPKPWTPGRVPIATNAIYHGRLARALRRVPPFGWWHHDVPILRALHRRVRPLDIRATCLVAAMLTAIGFKRGGDPVTRTGYLLAESRAIVRAIPAYPNGTGRLVDAVRIVDWLLRERGVTQRMSNAPSYVAAALRHPSGELLGEVSNPHRHGRASCVRSFSTPLPSGAERDIRALVVPILEAWSFTR